MFAHRSIGIRTLSLLWQLIVVAVSYWGWLFIWEGAVFAEGVNLWRYFLYFEFLLIGIVFGIENRYRTVKPTKDWPIALRASLRQAFCGLFSVFLMVFVIKDVGISRSFFFSYLPSLFASLLFTNYWLPLFIGQLAFSGDREERAALVGNLENAARFQSWLERKELMGMRTVGVVCAGPGEPAIASLPVLGFVEDMREILRANAITQLIVLNLSLGSERLREITQLCEDAAVRLVVLHDLQSYFNHKTVLFEDDGIRFIGLREEPLESPLNRFLKRLLDLSLALPVVICLLPFTNAFVWLLHRIYSPGPLFFRQVRNGMLGRPFVIYKYRSMHLNNNEALQATRNDARIFPGGNWLRKLSLDELPQFINVLRGEMSVIGPRPHLPQHDEAYAKVMRNYLIRRFIRPGITGWAQVAGHRGEIRSESDIQQRVEADIHYLENWSFGLDVLIVLKTAKQCVVPPQTAY